MLLLCCTCAGQEVVENVEASFTRRYDCQPGSFKPVVEQLAANECRACRGAIILELVEQTCLGRSLGGMGFCGGQSVENESGEGQFR